MEIFQPNQTSARLLVTYAKEKYFKVQENKNIEKYLIVYDIFIKARSYYIINKIFFFLALLSGIVVLLWPSLAIFAKDFGWEKGFLNSAIVQTTVTGIAALTFAIYSHYKKRQMYAENLMRFTIFSEEPLINIKDYVVQEMERIDSGFSFGKSVLKEKKDQKSAKG
ncbi:hypothetical protein [Desulfospira joergensenii]|uniref:hypothetical protein n=1 Tax=Desulfospira joergensenii TaxID=53329 RepID=UPI0003B46F0F|nr:hypothetical protein [Desulfospira joergensenii]